MLVFAVSIISQVAFTIVEAVMIYMVNNQLFRWFHDKAVHINSLTGGIISMAGTQTAPITKSHKEIIVFGVYSGFKATLVKWYQLCFHEGIINHSDISIKKSNIETCVG